jgi:hypothetical protein
MVFMAESRGDTLRHLGRNSSFRQWRYWRLDSDAEVRFEVERGGGEETTDEGKIKGRTLRLGAVVAFQ